MKIFIGSSQEESEVMKKVSELLRKCGHQPLPWNNAIYVGRGTLIDQLIDLSHKVDGAIFIFAEDDKTVVRGEERLKPRDNVVFEYGLFTGTLGETSVVFLRVANANIATDLHGVVYIDLPNPSEVESVKEKIVDWANRLTPVYVRGLEFDLAKHLLKMIARGLPVGTILGKVAPRLVDGNTSNEIRALCSDKGTYSKPYYSKQFDWVAKEPRRRIKRVFVRARGNKYGFSPGETLGIKMHLDQASNGVKIKWIFVDDPWLEGPYSSSLGFAIFGKSWIIHWGLKSGAFHKHGKGKDYGVLRLLERRFNHLWKHATEFDASLIKRIRKR